MPPTPRPPPADGRVVAVTGACTFLGGGLLRPIAEDRRDARLLPLDVRPPPMRPAGQGAFLEVGL